MNLTPMRREGLVHLKELKTDSRQAGGSSGPPNEILHHLVHVKETASGNILQSWL